jgi:hypothetical protein
MSRTKITMKVASGIPDDIERRIVDLSLRHPDFGAKRLLPLLKDEEIDVSTSTQAPRTADPFFEALKD